MNDLSFAILFEELYIDELQFPVYIPIRPIIGYSNKKSELFIDKYSAQTYINLDYAYSQKLPEGFNLVHRIKDLMIKYKSLSRNDTILNSWLEVEKYIYFYGKDGLEFKCCTPEDFEKVFKVKIPMLSTYQINNLNLALTNGKVSSDDYYNALYSNDYNSSISITSEEKVNTSNEYPNICEVMDKVSSKVICQDETIKRVITSIYRSLYFGRDKFKSNIFMYGPTGVGKTAIVKAIGEVLNVSVCIEDMTRFTETGYVGKSVDDILLDLYYNADCDLEKAENSIVFLDEIDKKADKDTSKSFNKGDVLKSLLTIIEGGKYEIEDDKHRVITFDTSKLIVIMAGAFSDLYKKAMEEKVIGFNKSKEIVDRKVNVEDLEKYGIPSEFIGRLSLVTRLNSLKLEDLIKILKKSELSVLRKYILAFKDLGIDIKIPEDVYKNIALKAEKFNKGARILNLVADETFENVVFQILNEGKDNIKEVIIGENIVEDKDDFKLVKKLS